MNERDRPAEGAGHAQDARSRNGDLPGQPLDLRGSELSGIPGRLDAPSQILDILQGVRLGYVVPGLPGFFQFGNVGFQFGLQFFIGGGGAAVVGFQPFHRGGGGLLLPGLCGFRLFRGLVGGVHFLVVAVDDLLKVFVKVISPFRPKVQIRHFVIEDFKDVIHLFQLLPEFLGGQHGVGDFVNKPGQSRVVVEGGFHPGAGGGQGVGVLVKFGIGVFQGLFIFRPHAVLHGGAGFFSGRFDTGKGIRDLVHHAGGLRNGFAGFPYPVQGCGGLSGSGSVGGRSDVDVQVSV
ncbi:hypothetical protein [Akkermansia muciniphila]|uniref:hypothetical protein n=1 Tax=Akkermansia muciniphila TaxID=239935 RepID=UPI0011788407|nr:hypothetical protein [Akkermansia muciniphila]